mmetsp:Transcript_36766/g.88406  ORF Transcript_36766/g.88406 Transcript_36766/m.88406 type:complete len:283 (-) Transcript_36766:57-905(-)
MKAGREPIPRKRRANAIAIIHAIFAPWFVFVVLFAVMSFSFHYNYPSWAWLVALSGYGLMAMQMGSAIAAQRAGMSVLWPGYMVFALFGAVSFATVMGDMNFWYNLQPYYHMITLNTYPDVDPAEDRGDAMLDAGRVYFAPGTRVDPSKAMGFKNLLVYCVAPIVHGDVQPESYDFWAVGIDCCSGASPDFRCGEYKSRSARSALRLTRDDQRPFFELAVQQAEAAYSISAPHPLFFYWLKDPVSEMVSFRTEGYKFYLLGVFTHFAVNLFFVTFTGVLISG